jgi:hypothetical protein
VQAFQALEQPQPLLSKCESGERLVDFVELQTFARLYGVPIGYFEEAKPETPAKKRILDPKADITKL